MGNVENSYCSGGERTLDLEEGEGHPIPHPQAINCAESIHRNSDCSREKEIRRAAKLKKQNKHKNPHFFCFVYYFINYQFNYKN